MESIGWLREGAEVILKVTLYILRRRALGRAERGPQISSATAIPGSQWFRRLAPYFASLSWLNRQPHFPLRFAQSAASGARQTFSGAPRWAAPPRLAAGARLAMTGAANFFSMSARRHVRTVTTAQGQVQGRSTSRGQRPSRPLRKNSEMQPDLRQKLKVTP
jgi:hypothetical protein